MATYDHKGDFNSAAVVAEVRARPEATLRRENADLRRRIKALRKALKEAGAELEDVDESFSMVGERVVNFEFIINDIWSALSADTKAARKVRR